jgi:acetylglutamate kinase
MPSLKKTQKNINKTSNGQDNILERPILKTSSENTVDSLETNSHSVDAVIKIGGSTLGDHDTTINDLIHLQKQGKNIVVIHGGGKIVSDWMKKQGIRPKFVEGLRVTDIKSLEIVVSVLTGLINKQLVSEINSNGGKAIGISGVDGSMILASVVNPDLGYVGKVESIDPKPIKNILKSGYIPVISPIGLNCDATADGIKSMLNINADTVAGYISAELRSKRMIFLTDVPGVLDSSKRLIARITASQAASLIRSNVIAGGMIPKLEACLKALDGGASSQIIDGREIEALKNVVEGDLTGTKIG